MVENMKMCYEEVVKAIEKKGKFGSFSGCEMSRIMLAQLEHPERGLPFIHIAGTNGKGSVSAFLCSVLKEAGLKVGMFTSPHLTDFRERIQINRELISKEDFVRLGKLLLEQDFGIEPAMTDYCLAMAMLYFRENQCDVVILETGLGGRLDSTNAIGTPLVSVITKIGYDHTAILGNTLQEIAGEKAGIIKTGTRLICESQEPEAEEVFYRTAEEVNVKSIRIIKKEELQITGQQTFSAYGYNDLKMKMLGLHQFENAAAAILAAEAFWEETYGKVRKDELTQAVRNGVANTSWAGRMQILSEEPFFMVDGAHNSNGIAALCESLRILFPQEKFHFLFGVLADKDYEEMIRELLPLALDFTTVTVAHGGSVEAEKLAEYIRSYGIMAESKANLKEALSEITKNRKEKTIALGSLYFIGEIML